MYQLIDLIPGKPAPMVRRVSDNAFIPMDPGNQDYVEYLEWLEAGNEPLPASGEI